MNVWQNDKPIHDFQKNKTKLLLGSLKKGVKPHSIIGLKATTNLGFLLMMDVCRKLDAIGINLARIKKLAEDPISCYLHFYMEEQEDGEIEISSCLSISQSVPAPTSFICSTSGTTTGQAKYICWGNQGILHQVTATQERMGYKKGDKVAITLPLWSSYGLSLYFLAKELQLDLIFINHLHPRRILECMASLQVTSFHGVPQIYSLLLDYIERNPERLSATKSIRIWDCGGDVLPYLLAKKWLHVIGQPILDGYGLTEAGPNVALNGPESYRLGTVGKPLKEVELKIAEGGELLVKSPSLMVGTIVPDKKQSLLFDHAHWLHTGDMASLDNDGFVTLLGRKKNIIIIHGHNLLPEQIEKVIGEFQGVEFVGVAGVERKGRAQLIAGIKSSNEFSVTNLKKWCHEKLPQQAIPKHFIHLDSLPLSHNGKLDRIGLQKKLEQLMQ